jgi:hypothetical protein
MKKGKLFLREPLASFCRAVFKVQHFQYKPKLRPRVIFLPAIDLLPAPLPLSARRQFDVKIDQDPRERVVSVAYDTLVTLSKHRVQAATDASNAAWFGIHDIPKLAFDYEEILEVALERLRGKVRYQPIGFELLPQKFTLTQLQTLYEIVLGRELDKLNQRKYRRRVKEGFDCQL